MIKKLLQTFQSTATESLIEGDEVPVTEPELIEQQETAVHEGISLLFPIGHFYSPIADPVDISARADKIWNNTTTLQGIDLNVDQQLSLLKKLKPYTKDINYPIAHNGDETSYFYQNDQYSVLDAEFLYAALCHFKPKTVIRLDASD